MLEDVGCIINLRNPFVTQPWACDTGSLVRLINAGNVLHASNPTTAASLIASFELALKAGKKLPLSFYPARVVRRTISRLALAPSDELPARACGTRS